ncbi:nicotinamide riboside transporter PnuC [Limosilactobacillus reuteri]|uniref:nicotinamide riboside transporter PnuC n=1 Tax=Limosilactobacillus reuteri TaxID=1598 RepID=UPI003CFD2804
MFTQYKDVLTHLPEYSKNIFRKGYFKWLFGQMKSWSKFSWGLIGFNFIVQILLAIQGSATVPLSHTIIGFLSANLSVLCVVGISNKSAIQGWFGATSAICIAFNAYLAHNYADMTLQLFYLVFLDIFCILSPSWNDNIKVHSIGGLKGWLKYIVFFFVSWGIIYYVYGLLNDPRLFLDSLTLAVSLTGALLEFNLAKEQFVFWILGSVITLALWGQTAIMGDANWALFASYSVFLLNDMYALFGKNGWFRKQEVVTGFGDKQVTITQ